MHSISIHQKLNHSDIMSFIGHSNVKQHLKMTPPDAKNKIWQHTHTYIIWHLLPHAFGDWNHLGSRSLDDSDLLDLFIGHHLKPQQLEFSKQPLPQTGKSRKVQWIQTMIPFLSFKSWQTAQIQVSSKNHELLSWPLIFKTTFGAVSFSPPNLSHFFQLSRCTATGHLSWLQLSTELWLMTSGSNLVAAFHNGERRTIFHLTRERTTRKKQPWNALTPGTWKSHFWVQNVWCPEGHGRVIYIYIQMHWLALGQLGSKQHIIAQGPVRTWDATPVPN